MLLFVAVAAMDPEALVEEVETGPGPIRNVRRDMLLEDDEEFIV
jgi:hypothetical protein